jgi:RNA polymerase sigma-70 factor (ECF subfamily)
MAAVQRLTRWFAAPKAPPPTATDAPEADDWRLLRAASQGHAPSARQLVQRLTPQARGLAMRLLGRAEDVDDVLQDAYMRLWTSAATDGHGARLATYFNTIVINRCRSLLTTRREWATDPAALDTLHDEMQADGRLAASPGGRDGSAEAPARRDDRLARALADLPLRQRLAITLWAYADASTADIAVALELDLNATHQLLHRARRKLRLALEGDLR